MNAGSEAVPVGASRSAVLFDFGGVITSSVFRAFGDFGEQECGDRRLPLRLLAEDPESKQLLVDHEEGRLGDEGFEEGYAARLRANGANVEAAGLLRRMQSHIGRDDAMVELVARLRASGVSVGMVSNSLGSDCYAGYDIDAMFDAVAISGREGVRKPSRRLYEIGCERLGVLPAETIMVDDLAQNITAAERLGMAGVVHRSAEETEAALFALLDERFAGARAGSAS